MVGAQSTVSRLSLQSALLASLLSRRAALAQDYVASKDCPGERKQLPNAARDEMQRVMKCSV